MAAVAAGNPNPNADLRSILLIAFLLRLQTAAAARVWNVKSWCETEKGAVSEGSAPADSARTARSSRTVTSAHPASRATTFYEAGRVLEMGVSPKRHNASVCLGLKFGPGVSNFTLRQLNTQVSVTDWSC